MLHLVRLPSVTAVPKMNQLKRVVNGALFCEGLLERRISFLKFFFKKKKLYIPSLRYCCACSFKSFINLILY